MGSPRKLRMWKLSRIRWFCRLHLRRLKSIFKEKLNIVKIFFLSLCYNDFLDKYYVADTAMEPMFWFVDHFTKFFGPLFVFAVCSLILTGVLIIYLIGIPYWWNKDPLVLCILFVIGHWLLVNIVFHYYMAAVTHPGYLPEGILIPEAVSICKKCISPKPPRTHHCSICNKCILKMDHHCPWLNNCIGHYNHRYFFLFMLYMVAGIVFVMVFGYGIVYEHFWEDKVPFSTKESQNNDTLMRKLNRASDDDDDDQEPYSWTTWLADYHKNMPLIERMKSQYWYHVCIVYLSLLCSGVLVALGALTVWHARLITRGETSIEAHINKNETKRLKLEKKFYINPYNFGASDNWKIFLGIQNGRTWRHVIFPSWHKPEGNGLQWRIAY